MFAGMAANQPVARATGAGITLGRGRFSIPLPEIGLHDVVQIDADAAHGTLVDLHLVQVCGGVREAFRRSPVVLPEPGAEAVLQRPVDGLRVAVDTDALMSENGFPAA